MINYGLPYTYVDKSSLESPDPKHEKTTKQSTLQVSAIPAVPTVELTCFVCGKVFARSALVWRMNKVRYQRPCCSRSCACRLGNYDSRRAGKTTSPGLVTWHPVDGSDKATKLRANGLVNMRIRRGKLARPDRCQDCGKVGRVDGHHPDYSQPDRVEWLCRRCHATRHRKTG